MDVAHCPQDLGTKCFFKAEGSKSVNQRRPGFSSRHPRVAHNHLSLQLQTIWLSLLTSTDTRHKCDDQIWPTDRISTDYTPMFSFPLKKFKIVTHIGYFAASLLSLDQLGFGIMNNESEWNHSKKPTKHFFEKRFAGDLKGSIFMKCPPKFCLSLSQLVDHWLPVPRWWLPPCFSTLPWG